MVSAARGRGAQHLEDGVGEARPGIVRRDELFLPGRRQAVELRSPIMLADAPLRRDESPLLQLVERGIERALFHLQDVARAVLDPARDAVAMARRPGERFEDHQVERALQEIHAFVHSSSASCGSAYPRTPRYIHRSPRVSKRRGTRPCHPEERSASVALEGSALRFAHSRSFYLESRALLLHSPMLVSSRRRSRKAPD